MKSTHLKFSPSSALFASTNNSLCSMLGLNLVCFTVWIMDAYKKARSLAAELAYVGRYRAAHCARIGNFD